MTIEVQRRRGTTTQHSTFVGAHGEVTVDTDKKVMVVHDGITPGGFPSAPEGFVYYKTSTLLLASTEGSRGVGEIWEAGAWQFEEHNATADEVTAGLVNLWEFGLFFTTLARFKAAIARGNTYPENGTVIAEGISYVKDGGTSITGLTGWSETSDFARLDGIDADQAVQDGRLNDIDADQITQDGKILALEALGVQGYAMTSGGPVATSTTANITLSGEQTLDGVLTSAVRVLVKDQTAAEDNGIYVSAAGAWARATDMDAAGEVLGTGVFVSAGTASGGKTFLSYSVVTTLNTDDIIFVEGPGNSGIQDQIDTLEGTIDLVASYGPGFIVPPPAIDALAHILRIEIYRSIEGGAVTMPTLLTVREVARDALDRFRLRIASFDGVSTYAEVLTENNSGGASLNVAGLTGPVWLDLLTSGTALGPANDVVVGRALIDFSDGSTFGTYAGTIDYAAGGIDPTQVQTGPRFDNDVNELIDTSIAINAGVKIPFSDDMRGDKFLRKFVRGLWLYGKEEGHEYAISTCAVEEFVGIPLTRFRFEIYDVTAGAVACSMRYQISSAPGIPTFIAAIPDKVKLNDYLLGSETHVYAVADLDWSVVASTFSVGGTTMADGGIHPSRCLSDEQAADSLDADRWDEVIRCGSGEAYTTLRALVEATYSDLTGSTLIKGSPICEQSHYHNRVLGDIIDDGNFTATGLYLPDQVDLRGNGMDRTFIRRENINPDPLIEMRASGKMSDMTMISETAGEYCIHSDDFNRNATDDNEQNTRLRQSFKRLRLQGGAGHNGWLFGCGISSGQIIQFEDVHAEHLDASATEPSFGFHNTGPTLSTPALKASYKPALVIMRGCSSPDQTGIQLSTLEPSATCNLILIGCDFNLIRVQTSGGAEVLSDLASDRNAWRMGGRYDGAWLREDPVGEDVLKTTAGQTPSGDAAALIFGTVDELGRGNKWIGDGNVYDLGERLGDCSSTSKSLTIGGETHTFTADETAKNNATLLSEINASITTYTLSIVDVQLEWVPDAAPKRRMNNGTGSTIPKGRFVKFTGAGAIALCGAGERPDGWTYRDILNGDDGYVVLTRKIADAYIEIANSSTGEWGITTAGTLDYGSVTKLGRTIGGIVSVW